MASLSHIRSAESFSLNFCGVPEENFSKASVVLLPIPYDATTTYRAGTREGPQAILQASLQLEDPWGEDSWHPLVDEQFVYTLGQGIAPYGASTREHLASFERLIREEVVLKKKIPFLLGGEHSLTFSNVSALYRTRKDFSILHFDAHTDLRPSYHGDHYSHSAVLRRSFELGPKVSLTSVGIRSIDRDVQSYLTTQQKKNSPSKSLHIFSAPDVPVDEIEKTLKKDVYITFDLDAFDPSIMPAVGTPQPGGLGWYPVLGLLEHVIARHRIIGMDVVELAPIPGLIAPDFLAAKLVWSMIEMLWRNIKPRTIR